MFYVGMSDLIRYLAVAFSGVPVEGQVLDRQVFGYKLYDHKVQYKFVLDGQQYTNWTEVGSSSYDDFSTGQSVRVLYVSVNPTWSNLAGFNHFNEGIFLYFSPFAMLGGLLLVWDFRRSHRRGTGQLITARVIDSRRDGNTIYVNIQFSRPGSDEVVTTTSTHDTNLYSGVYLWDVVSPLIGQNIEITYYNTGEWDYLLPALHQTDLKLTAPSEFWVLS